MVDRPSRRRRRGGAVRPAAIRHTRRPEGAACPCSPRCRVTRNAARRLQHGARLRSTGPPLGADVNHLSAGVFRSCLDSQEVSRRPRARLRGVGADPVDRLVSAVDVRDEPHCRRSSAAVLGSRSRCGEETRGRSTRAAAARRVLRALGNPVGPHRRVSARRQLERARADCGAVQRTRG